FDGKVHNAVEPVAPTNRAYGKTVWSFPQALFSPRWKRRKSLKIKASFDLWREMDGRAETRRALLGPMSQYAPLLAGPLSL
ncbi:hypothetical protein, partial [Bradyrhizobium sp. AS23.2]|uniref:hypothetical protein n=1 Tax=Bradyrhizobium sp. AS23.2 TaxID=1680155 RepID=UPI001AD7F755